LPFISPLQSVFFFLPFILLEANSQLAAQREEAIDHWPNGFPLPFCYFTFPFCCWFLSQWTGEGNT
jgi:hypothetical protein